MRETTEFSLFVGSDSYGQASPSVTDATGGDWAPLYPPGPATEAAEPPASLSQPLMNRRPSGLTDVISVVPRTNPYFFECH